MGLRIGIAAGRPWCSPGVSQCANGAAVAHARAVDPLKRQHGQRARPGERLDRLGRRRRRARRRPRHRLDPTCAVQIRFGVPSHQHEAWVWAGRRQQDMSPPPRWTEVSQNAQSVAVRVLIRVGGATTDAMGSALVEISVTTCPEGKLPAGQPTKLTTAPPLNKLCKSGSGALGPEGPAGPATPGSPFVPAKPAGPEAPRPPDGPASPAGPTSPAGPLSTACVAGDFMTKYAPSAPNTALQTATTVSAMTNFRTDTPDLAGSQGWVRLLRPTRAERLSRFRYLRGTRSRRSGQYHPALRRPKATVL